MVSLWDFRANSLLLADSYSFKVTTSYFCKRSSCMAFYLSLFDSFSLNSLDSSSESASFFRISNSFIYTSFFSFISIYFAWNFSSLALFAAILSASLNLYFSTISFYLSSYFDMLPCLSSYALPPALACISMFLYLISIYCNLFTSLILVLLYSTSYCFKSRLWAT